MEIDLINKIRHTKKYKDFRNRVLYLNGNLCEECGLEVFSLEIHHIKKCIDILKDKKPVDLKSALSDCDEIFDLNNIICLCGYCHKQIHYPD